MEQFDVDGRRSRLYQAGDPDDGPGVAVFHAWWGLNDDVIGYAERLAKAGFWVLAPDLFGGPVADTIEDADRLSSALDEDAADAIALAVIDRLAARSKRSKVGTLGFSLGGAWTMWTAGQRDQVAASVVYYGSLEGPSLARSSVPVLGHFAESDPYESDKAVATFERALRDAGRDVQIHRYPGTGHWFAEPSRDAYQAAAADLAFQRTVSFVRRHLTDDPGAS